MIIHAVLFVGEGQKLVEFDKIWMLDTRFCSIVCAGIDTCLNASEAGGFVLQSGDAMAYWCRTDATIW